MRIVYSSLLYLLWPVVLVLMLQQMRKRSGGLRFFVQRMGLVAPTPSNSIDALIHAASVGELNSLLPLLRELCANRQLRVVVSVNTPEAMRALEVFVRTYQLGEKLAAVYCPVDFYWATRRFMARLQPTSVFVVEAEIWPNLYAESRKSGASLHIINGHFKRPVESLSALSKWFYVKAFSQVNSIAARSVVCAERYVSLGVDSQAVNVLGNLKFCQLEARSFTPPTVVNGLRYALFVSSREGEESTVWQQWSQMQCPPLLVIAPRHMQRIQSIHQTLAGKGANVAILSQGDNLDAATEVLIVDSMGRVDEFLAGAEFGLLGGTFVDIGGHNILQIALADRHVFVGPYTQNIDQELHWLKDAGVATQINNVDAELALTISRFEETPKASFEELRKKSHEILEGYGEWVLSAIKMATEKK